MAIITTTTTTTTIASIATSPHWGRGCKVTRGRGVRLINGSRVDDHRRVQRLACCSQRWRIFATGRHKVRERGVEVRHVHAYGAVDAVAATLHAHYASHQ